MLEQFAFGIAFDVENDETSGDVEEPPSPEWLALVNQIATEISETGLPATESDRWEEFGSGQIFWGTRAECEEVKRVFSKFPVCIQEERNLDPGYYATPSAFYHVTENGEITGLSTTEPSPENLGKLNAIPLDAYRIKTIPRELEQQFQQIHLVAHQATPQDSTVQPASQSTRILELETELCKLEQQRSELHRALSQNIDPGEYKNLLQEFQALQQNSVQQSSQLTEFEAKVSELQSQVAHWQAVANTKIEPDDYESLRQQCRTQQDQIGALEHQVQQSAQQLSHFQEMILQRVDRTEYELLQQQLLEQVGRLSQFEKQVSELQSQVAHWHSVTASKIEVADYQNLQQQASNQEQCLAELTNHTQDLETEIARWQAISANKIDRAEYEAGLSQLNRLMTQKRQNWLSKLLGWLRGR